MKKIVLFLFFSTLVTAVTLAGDPDLFYYVSDETNELYSINRSTGVITLIGATRVGDIEAIAFYPIPGANILYAANGGSFGFLSLTTGRYTLIGEIDGGGFVNGELGPQTLNDVDGLMLDAETFIMWGIERNDGPTPDLIFQIDVTTGEFIPDAFGLGIDYLTIKGDGINSDVDDAAIDPITGKVYGVSNIAGIGDILFEVNKFTGIVSLTSSLAQDDVEGLAFSNNGQLYGTEGDEANRLGEINLTTGVLSNFISFVGNGDDVEALAALVADANTVSGRVFSDTNLDGIRDAGELGVANVKVFLYIDNDGDGLLDLEDTRVQTTTTDANGDYQFFYASTANLIVSTDVTSYPLNNVLTTDNVETISFTDNVNFAETDSGNDFGLGIGSDCDGDGLSNFFELSFNSDIDPVLDSCDLDADNDGILDAVEGILDFDNDGIPNYRDRDSDDDGIPDAIEANRGVIPIGYSSTDGNIVGVDTDGNGIVDAIETFAGSGVMLAPLPDSDGDGLPDYLDLDSDNDGILDITEAAGFDSDGDGQSDNDLDANNNGYKDVFEATALALPNTDLLDETVNGLTPLPNYIDIDSDGDGIDDTREGLSTLDFERPTLSLDSDQDGIIDFWDISTLSTPIVPNDNDGDRVPDYIDTDSDNDRILDYIEGNDVNQDGIADAAFTGSDVNLNGLDDVFEGNCATTITVNRNAYGEEEVNNGNMDIGSSDLEMPFDGLTNQLVGIHFADININQGGKISSAFIQFEVDEADFVGSIPLTLTLTIEGELIANAPTFTTANSNISNRTRTTTSVSWSPAGWNTVGEAGPAQLTTDIGPILQEIVNQDDWVKNNDIVIIISRFSGGDTRVAETDPRLIFTPAFAFCISSVAVQDTDGNGEVDFRDRSPDTDEDKDGIADIDDIDDDNDGILDTDECGGLNNLIVNGSFEPEDGTSDVNFLVSGGNADITLPGWTIIGDIDLVDVAAFEPSSFATGTQWIDLLGNSPMEVTTTTTNQRLDIQPGYVPNGIEQVVPIPSGNLYTLSFDYTSNIVTNSTAAEIFIDGELVSSVVFTGSSSFEKQSYSRTFVATGATETIRIIASVAAVFNLGLLVDNFSIIACPDTDGDGLPNSLDLDSDNDGVPDIVEAGGVDTDGNGIVDGAFADGDGDGFADLFDTDDGGTPLADSDTDGDGFRNRIDIDADNDGIVDNIEGQATAAFTAPTDMDTDTDGIDDAYDTDNGGTAIVLSNVDSDNDAIPDYLDQDSDNDTQPDWQEGFDDDLTGDVLDDLILRADNYETAAGNPLEYISTDDADGNTIPDFLEDSDEDNVPNFLDSDSPFYHDDDNDGLINLYDADNNGFSNNTPTSLSNIDGDDEPDFRDVDDVVTLPIELLDFNAVRIEDKVQLQWATITEINNDFFTVERSSDGKDFRGILTEPGAGNSTEPCSYKRFDISPLEGLNYYRLCQTDYNGDTDTFDIKVVDFRLTNVLVKLYPNPTTGEELFLELPNDREDSYKIDLVDSEGTIIKTMRREIYEGSSSSRVEILNGLKLASGTYYVIVQGTNFICTSSVVFQ